jgi:hypothetical protein
MGFHHKRAYTASEERELKGTFEPKRKEISGNCNKTAY